MTIKVTIPNTSNDSLTFGSANTPTAAQVVGIDSGSSNGQLAFNTTASGTSTEAMRITAAQNVGVGTTTPSYKLHVVKPSAGVTARFTDGDGITDVYGYGLEITRATGYIKSSGSLSFGGASGYSAVNIDSSGNFLVGTTSNYGGGRLDVAWDGTGNAAAVRASSASFIGASFIVYADRNTTNSTFKGLAYYNVGAAAYKFIVQDSGNVQNVNNSYGAISDIKLKENITDATPKLAQLNQVRVVNYNLIGDTNKQIGVVAQELEQVFPSMIDEEVDRDSEGNDLGTTTKSVKYSVFVPMLIKAIQEQQALITTLTERITALEAK
jgi:hypothetical protein